MGIGRQRLVHRLKRRRWCLLDETCILATLTSAMGWSVILTLGKKQLSLNWAWPSVMVCRFLGSSRQVCLAFIDCRGFQDMVPGGRQVGVG